MTLISNTNLIDIIVGIGVITYAVGQFRNGKKGKSKDDIDTENSAMLLLQNQVKTFKGAVEDLTVKVTDMGKQISALEAVNALLKTDRDNYRAIAENRNPEFEKFMGNISGTMIDIKNFMVKINEHMDVQNKDMKITATVTH